MCPCQSPSENCHSVLDTESRWGGNAGFPPCIKYGASFRGNDRMALGQCSRTVCLGVVVITLPGILRLPAARGFGGWVTSFLRMTFEGKLLIRGRGLNLVQEGHCLTCAIACIRTVMARTARTGKQFGSIFYTIGSIE
jgi:hypothetical protein